MRHQHARAAQPAAVRRNLARAGQPSRCRPRSRSSPSTSTGDGAAGELTTTSPAHFAAARIRPRMTVRAIVAALPPNRPPCPRVAVFLGHVLHGQQSPGQDAQAPRPHDRRLLAGGRANLLAVPRVEARLRSRRPAVVVHGHRDVVRHARPPRPHRRAAGVRGAAADDEDDAAGDLPAGRDDRPGAEAAAAMSRGWTAAGCRAICGRSSRATRSSCRASWS